MNRLAASDHTSAQTLARTFETALQQLPAAPGEAPQIVQVILEQARHHRASDVHLVPTESGTRMQWRIDGVLHEIAEFAGELGPRLVARLKVISGLLTYRTDVPQEGRIAREYSSAESRVSTLPTLHGEKAAIRLFAENAALRRVAQLGLPEDISQSLQESLRQTSGVILLTGPSGSGKTTTAYACLRDIVAYSEARRSVMTLEDPIEVGLEGVTQSQVRPSAGFDLPAGLRALMRQDPDVILVGEIRDPATAESVFQAALTGHLVLTTFHAGSAAETVSRLLEMGIEPYLMRSTIRSIICQRLLRRLCDHCKSESNGPMAEISTDKTHPDADPAGACAACGGTRFHGRTVLAELLDLSTPEMARVILQRCDATEIAQAAGRSGMHSLAARSTDLVTRNVTSQAEVFRVLGRQS